MKKFLFVLLTCSLFTGNAISQGQPGTSLVDSTLNADTVTSTTTEVSSKPRVDTAWTSSISFNMASRNFIWEVLQHHPYFGFRSAVSPVEKEDIRHITGKELMFYVILGLLVIFAFLRSLFPRYFSDMFRLFFRTTIKQRQIREQLMQTPLPSLLMNGFFIVSAALYSAFVIMHFGVSPIDNFWILVIYICAGLAIAYVVKFIGLKISGWLFNMKAAAEAYIFIVFIVNKMIGIMLLPFIVLLAFSEGDVYAVALTASWCMIAGLIGYRFILTYAAIRNQVKVNPFHFLLYLLAFEVAPLLLVYKGLLVYFSRTT